MSRPVTPVPGSLARTAPVRPPARSPEEGAPTPGAGQRHVDSLPARRGEHASALFLPRGHVSPRAPGGGGRAGWSESTGGAEELLQSPAAEVDRLLAEEQAALDALMAELATGQPDVDELLAQAEAEDRRLRVELGLERPLVHDARADAVAEQIEATGDDLDDGFDPELLALIEGEPVAENVRFRRGSP